MNKIARYLKAETIDDYSDYFKSEVIPLILSIDFDLRLKRYNAEVDRRKTVHDRLEMVINVEKFSYLHQIQIEITQWHLPRDNNYIIKITDPYQLRDENKGRFSGNAKEDADVILTDIANMLYNALQVAKKLQML